MAPKRNNLITGGSSMELTKSTSLWRFFDDWDTKSDTYKCLFPLVKLNVSI